MEDFASVIWIVIIVGAMVFNVVSQSRKARGKSGHAPQHGEAWPSSTTQTPESAPRPAPTLRPELQPVTPAFPDECQSLEEIPVQEYTPEYTEQKNADSRDFRRKNATQSRHDAETDEIAAHSLTDNAPETSTTTLAEDFDLRQAVIYSEILKPKFEEHL